VGDDSERVAAEKNRSTVAAVVGVADALLEGNFELLTALLFAEATGDENDSVGFVVLDDLGDDRRHLVGADRNHDEVDLGRQLREARNARNSVDLRRRRVDHVGAIAIEAGGKDVVENDPPHVAVAL
jgi:hypothetical protein